MNTSNTNFDLCNSCQNLIGKTRETEPHEYLNRAKFKAVRSMYGARNETYYQCKICRMEWLYETGTYGRGWVKDQTD